MPNDVLHFKTATSLIFESKMLIVQTAALAFVDVIFCQTVV